MTPTTYAALILAGMFLLTMPVFAVVSRNRPVDADVARRPTTFLLGTWVRDWLMWLISPAERAFVSWGLSPDLFNYFGGLMGLFAGFAYAKESLALGGWLVLLGGVADIIDGRIARARRVASDYGEFLDSMLDRFAEMFAFIGLAVYFEAVPLAMTATILALGGSLMVSYARAKGEGVRVDCRGGVMQRAERRRQPGHARAPLAQRRDLAHGDRADRRRLDRDGGLPHGVRGARAPEARAGDGGRETHRVREARALGARWGKREAAPGGA